MSAFKAITFPASSKPARFFTSLAVAGVAVTITLVSNAAVKADNRIKDLDKEEASPEVKILETWHIYVPAVIAASATVFCILGASRLSRLRSEALLMAFMIEPLVSNNQEPRQ